MSDYKYIGKEKLCIIYGGINTMVLPGGTVKKFFLPFFRKKYPQYLAEINPTSEIKITDTIPLVNTLKVVGDTCCSDIGICCKTNESDTKLKIPTPILTEEQTVLKYPYTFKDHVLTNLDSLNRLYKEELQVLASELGMSSTGKKHELMDKINKLLV